MWRTGSACTCLISFKIKEHLFQNVTWSWTRSNNGMSTHWAFPQRTAPDEINAYAHESVMQMQNQKKMDKKTERQTERCVVWVKKDRDTCVYTGAQAESWEKSEPTWVGWRTYNTASQLWRCFHVSVHFSIHLTLFCFYHIYLPEYRIYWSLVAIYLYL